MRHGMSVGFGEGGREVGGDDKGVCS